MLSAIVTSQVGLRNVTLVLGESHGAAGIENRWVWETLGKRGVKRDGRTVVSVVVGGAITSQDQEAGKGLIGEWLRQRNEVLREVKVRDDGKETVMVCEAGRCWEIKDGDVLGDEGDEGLLASR